MNSSGVCSSGATNISEIFHQDGAQENHKYLARWWRAFFWYGVAPHEVDDFTVVSDTLKVGPREYPTRIVKGGLREIRKEGMAQQEAGTSKCFLCAELEHIKNHHDGYKHGVIHSFSKGMVIPNRYPAHAGHALYVSHEHAQTVPVRSPRKVTQGELYDLLSWATGQSLYVARNHPLDGMSIPDHDHFHLYPSTSPLFPLFENALRYGATSGELPSAVTPFSSYSIVANDLSKLTWEAAAIIESFNQAGVVHTWAWSPGLFIITPRKSNALQGRLGYSAPLLSFSPLWPGYVKRVRASLYENGSFPWRRFVGTGRGSDKQNAECFDIRTKSSSTKIPKLGVVSPSVESPQLKDQTSYSEFLAGVVHPQGSVFMEKNGIPINGRISLTISASPFEENATLSGQYGAYFTIPKSQIASLLFFLELYRDRKTPLTHPVFQTDLENLYVLCVVNSGSPDSGKAPSIAEGYRFESAHILEYFDLVHLLLHHPSRTIITHGTISQFLTPEGEETLRRVLQFRKWLWENVPSKEQWRFMFFSSAILFAYGVRIPNDIDLYIHRNSEDEVLPRRLTKDLYDEPIYAWLEPKCRGLGTWVTGGVDERLNQWFLFDWPKLAGAESMFQVVVDPEHHFYFMGLKCISLRADIARRVKRQRPAAFADLIALMRTTRLGDIVPISLPPLPEQYWSRHELVTVAESDKDAFVRTIVRYLQTRYGILETSENVGRTVGHTVACSGRIKLSKRPWRIENKHNEGTMSDFITLPKSLTPRVVPLPDVKRRGIQEAVAVKLRHRSSSPITKIYSNSQK